MAEEKKENVSAETETHENDEKKSTVENLEAQKVEAENAPEAADIKAEGKKAEPEKEKESTPEKKETKAEEVEEVKEEEQEELPQPSALIGDLNFLAEVRNDLPTVKSGDIIRVSYRVIEGGKERTQVFEGTVIAIKHSGISKTITVRKTSFGIAVERIFPLNSKLVQNIDITKHSKVRRAKLYFLRNLKGKAARLKELR